MANPSTIERLPDESARAYRARIEYVTMGEARSLETLAQKYNKSRSLFARWSTQYDWQATARAWDDQQAAALVAAAADKYRADLEAHRDKATQAGDALYTVAGQLIKAINTALASPRTIKGADGRTYTVHNIELNANTFSIAARAMQTALDLKAHALGVDKLLPSLGDDSE